MKAKSSLLIFFAALPLFSGCCTDFDKNSKVLTLDQAMDAVHNSIVRLQKENHDSGMLLSQAQVQLTLTAQVTASGNVSLGVTLPVAASLGGSLARQNTASNQITFTFQNFLSTPTTTVAGALYTASQMSRVTTQETDVTNPTTNTVVKTTTSDSSVPNIEALSAFLKDLANSGGYIPLFNTPTK